MQDTEVYNCQFIILVLPKAMDYMSTLHPSVLISQISNHLALSSLTDFLLHSILPPLATADARGESGICYLTPLVLTMTHMAEQGQPSRTFQS